MQVDSVSPASEGHSKSPIGTPIRIAMAKEANFQSEKMRMSTSPSCEPLGEAPDLGEHISVQIHGTKKTLPFQIDANETAQQVCTKISNELKLMDVDLSHHVIILVYNLMISGEDGSFEQECRFIVRTLSSSECPVKYYREALQKHPCLKESLKPTEKKPKNYTDHAIGLIFKDTRTAPLEFDGDMSGNESSDEERGFAWKDTSHLGVGEKSGYLLRKSQRDPCLWRKRWCVLAADRLWILKHSQTAKQKYSQYISLVGCTVKEDAFKGNSKRQQLPFSCRFAVLTAHHDRAYHFRASSKEDMIEWIQSIRKLAALAEENNYIAIAEHMICDQEAARTRRYQRIMGGALTQSGLLPLLVRNSRMSERTDQEKRAKEHYLSKEEFGDSPWPYIKKRDNLAKCFAFLDAVAGFEEMIRFSFPNEVNEKWEKVQRILDEFCLSSSSEKNTTFYGGIPFSSGASTQIKEKLVPYREYLNSVRPTLPHKGTEGGMESTDSLLSPPEATIFEQMKQEAVERLIKSTQQLQYDAGSWR